MDEGCFITLPLASSARTLSGQFDALYEERSIVQRGIKAAIRYGLRSSTVKLEHNSNSDVVKEVVRWVRSYGYLVRVMWDKPEDNHCYLFIRW